jgi:hypothetical protein
MSTKRKASVKLEKPKKAELMLGEIEYSPEDVQSADELKLPNDFPWTLAVAEEALKKVNPDIEREEWRKIISGLMTQFGKTAEAKRLADRWSEGKLHANVKPKGFDAAENERQWNSYEPGHVSIGRLYQLATKGGWDPIPARQEQAEKSDAILVGMDDSRTLAIKTWKKITEQETGDPRLFRYGRQVARLDEDIEILTADALWQLLCSRLKYAQLKSRRLVHCDPPKSLITYIMNTPARDLPLPELLGVTRTPVLAPDGSIHTAAGYSPDSKHFHFPNVEVGKIPEAPSPKEIRTARELLEEVICDFPFVHQSDHAHAIAMMVLPFVRPMVKGSTPIHLLNKPTQGTGATLLGEIATLIKTGKRVEAANAPKSDDEWLKTIIAKLLSVPEFFFLDNVTKIKSEALATALTADIYEGRRLGVSEMVRLPVQCTWIMTGNNPELSADFPRRVLHIRLDANMERPESGRKFRHEDLKEWVQEERGRLIAAILTLSRAWIAAGRPDPDETMASFEGWARVVGGILKASGIKGFLQTPANRRIVDDPFKEEEREFATVWLYHFMADPIMRKVKARKLLEMATRCGLAIASGRRSSEHGDLTAFGRRLRGLDGQVFVIPAMDRLPNEDRPEVTVKLVRTGADGDASWVLDIREVAIVKPGGAREVRPKVVGGGSKGSRTEEVDLKGLDKTMFWSESFG